MFGIEFLSKKEGVWYIGSDRYSQPLEQQLYPFYVALEDGWYEVEYGPASAWHRPISDVEAASVAPGQSPETQPAPAVTTDGWMARTMGRQERRFPLEEGMAVKHFGGNLDYSEWPLEPAGKCVCSVSVKGDDGAVHSAGRLALDLATPPFAAHHWPLGADGTVRAVDTIDLDLQSNDDYELTKEFFGCIDEALWFWLLLI